MKKAFLLTIFIIQFLNAGAQTKIFENQELRDSLEVCKNHIYNYQFDQAKEIIRYINSKTPNHPLNPFLYGLLYFWENFPLTPDNPNVTSFIDSLNQCIAMSQEILHTDRENPEINLLLLTSRALLMMYYADNGIYLKAFEHIYPGYKLAMKSFQLRESNDEFNYYTGLFNYYREEYPKAHPIYKPFVYFLKKGNTQKGLEELQYTAENCILMDTEAYVFLVIIYLNYENNPPKALKFAEKLYNSKSNNRFFLARYIELKLVANDSSKVEKLLQKLFNESVNDQFALMLAYIYKGLYEEKYNKNYTIASYDYKKGLRLAEKYNSYADNFRAYALFGLSRIYKLKEKDDMAEEYYEKAEEIAKYDYYF